MTAIATEAFQQLVQKLYESKLHFCLTETPFSAQISIRKKYLKPRNSPSASVTPKDEISDLKTQNLELQEKVKNTGEIIDILKNKLEDAEVQAIKVFEERKTEIDILKNSLKKSESELSSVKKDLENAHKAAKDKEKIIKKLDHKCGNLETIIKNTKSELNKINNENRKLLKLKSVGNKASLKKDLNENIQSDAVSLPCPSSSTIRTPSSPIQTAGTQLCDGSPCTTPPRPITPASAAPVTEPYTPPAASILTINESELPSSENVMLPPPQPCQRDETFNCYICNTNFLLADHLKIHALSDHGVHLCCIKLLDYEEKDPFLRFLKSIELDQDYIEDRKKHYPTHWEHVNMRIKFRRLAQVKLEITSRQIAKNIKENDVNSLRYEGWSYDTNDI